MVDLPEGHVIVPLKLPEYVGREGNVKWCLREPVANAHVCWERLLGHVAIDPRNPK